MPTPVRLSDLTTLRLGGPAPELITATTPAEIADALRDADAGAGALVVGGGSNLVVADAGVDVPVVRVAVPGVQVRPIAADVALVTVGAGVNWDDVVAELTASGYADLGPLSGIPGSAGATPVQNVGAYGTELSDVLVAVTLYDRVRQEIRTVPAAELGLGYRTSVLRGTDRAVVVDADPAAASRRHPDPLRRAGPDAGRPDRRLRATGGGPAGGADVAARQGDGAGPGRSGHHQRRVVLHQPDPGPVRRRSDGRRHPGPTRWGDHVSRLSGRRWCGASSPPPG